MNSLSAIIIFACCCFAVSNAAAGRRVSSRFTFGNATYEISANRAGWAQAKNDCRAKGMRLLSIESAEENFAILENIVLMPGERFWTSGSDLGHEGAFYWEATGHSVGPYINWAPDQPDNAQRGSEHCIELWHEANHLWNDNKCDTQSLYICEGHPCEDLINL